MWVFLLLYSPTCILLEPPERVPLVLEAHMLHSFPLTRLRPDPRLAFISAVGLAASSWVFGFGGRVGGMVGGDAPLRHHSVELAFRIVGPSAVAFVASACPPEIPELGRML